MDKVDDVLAHFGVKGMKWGVRKDGSRPSSASADHDRAQAIKKKARFGQTRRLSNDELKTLIERMNLEQQLTNLKRQTPEGEASKFVSDLLKDAGKQQIRKLVTKGGVKLLKAGVGLVR